MHKGFIDEQGNHLELINIGGRYQTLWTQKNYEMKNILKN